MVIRILTEPQEVLKIINLEDDPQDFMMGNKDEWIQWLVQQTKENSKIIIWGAYEEEELVGYLVLMDGRMPPLSYHAFIMYVYSGMLTENNKEAFREIINWCKKRDIRKIMIGTKTPKVMEKYGFKKSDTISMMMEL